MCVCAGARDEVNKSKQPPDVCGARETLKGTDF